jgi:hypothetical protein
MDANGARALSKRLEAHEHWRQAPAVLRGEQPATDPDAPELEELGDGIRLYRREVQASALNGASPRVTQRLCKRLIDGRWVTSIETETAA